MNNETQVEYWNGETGQKWADQADRLDEMLAPFSDKVLETANMKQDERALDIGCGAGALTLAATMATGGNTGALGVDISTPLVKLARKRAIRAKSAAMFEHADICAFTADLPFDLIISRFGVMFFENPTAAFAHARRQILPGGRLVFMCWQAPGYNDWISVPLQAALPLLNEPPEQPDPLAPGPFALASKDRIVMILRDAGWKGISVDPFDTKIVLPGYDTETSVKFALEFGPLSRLVAAQNLDPERVGEAITNRLASEVQDDGRIAMGAACWTVTAHAD